MAFRVTIWGLRALFSSFPLWFLGVWNMYFFPRMTVIALILGFQILSETGQGIRHMGVTVSLKVRVHVRVVSLVTAGLLETSSPSSWVFHTTSRVAPGRRQRGVGLTRFCFLNPGDEMSPPPPTVSPRVGLLNSVHGITWGPCEHADSGSICLGWGLRSFILTSSW